MLWRPPQKIGFANYKGKIFIQFNTLKIRECYLLRNFNINLLFKGKEIFRNKIGKKAH